MAGTYERGHGEHEDGDPEHGVLGRLALGSLGEQDPYCEDEDHGICT